MKNNPVYASICAACERCEKLYWVLLDPDDFSPDDGAAIAVQAEAAGADAILVGGSLLYASQAEAFVATIKKSISIPVILFPGDATQVAPSADAILFLSLVSGRNPDFLIGEQVKGAPLIREYGIEPISTAYMLVECGITTSVEFMSNTRPLPRTKPMIAAMHALAAQYIGMKLVYLEGGSGAKENVPVEMISAVRSVVDIPIICGGGIRTPEAAREKIAAGADIIVTGNLLRQKDGIDVMRAIASEIKSTALPR